MSAYQVKYNTEKKEYQVYKQDGMSTVGTFTSGAEAQSKAAIMNMQWQEQHNRTKQAAQALIDQEKQREQVTTAPTIKKDVPDPPAGQGVSY